MKPYAYLSAFLLAFAVGFASIPIATGQQRVDMRSGAAPSEASGDTVYASVDASANHDAMLKRVREAIAESDQIGPFRKWIIQRRLKRQHVAVAVTDYVTSEAMAEGYIVMAAGDDGEVVARVDLDGILAFIERLLPVILQIISLFGG